MNNYRLPIKTNTGPVSLFNDMYSTISQSTINSSFSNFRLLNLCLLGLFLIANFARWTLFGKISEKERENLKDRIIYTIWEFWFGFFIFVKEMSGCKISSSELIQHEFIKYSGLFFCVLMLKGFHLIYAERAYSLSTRKDPSAYYKFRRLGYGVLLLNFIDILLMAAFFNQVTRDSPLKFEHNILVAIFGFEIFHMYPIVFFTGIKFWLNYYEMTTFQSENTSKYQKWRLFKSKLLNLMEVIINFIQFGMSCVFAVVFLYYFTFPFHILPSSYLSLKLLIIKTRCLISFERRNLKLTRMNLPSYIDPDSKCIICFDYLNNSSIDGVRCLNHCSHNFHYTCIKSWLNYSNKCPICRKKI